MRMVYGVEDATDEFIPGIEAALKYFPSDSDVLIPKRRLPDVHALLPVLRVLSNKRVTLQVRCTRL